jgi:hypothetical protein
MNTEERDATGTTYKTLPYTCTKYVQQDGLCLGFTIGEDDLAVRVVRLAHDSLVRVLLVEAFPDARS